MVLKGKLIGCHVVRKSLWKGNLKRGILMRSILVEGLDALFGKVFA